MNEADFLIIDVETTGLSPESGDRVCEVGAIKVRGSAVVDTLGTLINPCRPISAGAFAVNRISPAMVSGAPTFSLVAERLRSMMENTILVGYNVPFDLSFLRQEFRLLGYPPVTHPSVDVLALARQLLPGLGRYPQDHVSRFLGIPFPHQHRALEDAMVTTKIFFLFRTILQAHDLISIADLVRPDLKMHMRATRIERVNTALRTGSDVWIRYLSASADGIIDGIVTPRGLQTDTQARDGAPYLLGYSRSDGAECRYHLDRILDLRQVPGNRIGG